MGGVPAVEEARVAPAAARVPTCDPRRSALARPGPLPLAGSPGPSLMEPDGNDGT